MKEEVQKFKFNDPSKVVTQEVHFKLGDKELTLNKWSLQVNAWLKNKMNMGSEEFFAKAEDVTAVGRVVYYLLKEKHLFPAQTVEEYDEMGVKREIFISGSEVMLRSMEPDDYTIIMKALFRCLGAGQPAIDMIDELEENKKKQVALMMKQIEIKMKERKKSKK